MLSRVHSIQIHISVKWVYLAVKDFQEALQGLATAHVKTEGPEFYYNNSVCGDSVDTGVMTLPLTRVTIWGCGTGEATSQERATSLLTREQKLAW